MQAVRASACSSFPPSWLACYRQVLKPAQLAKAAQLKARMQALYDEMHSLMRGNNLGAGQDDNGPALSRNP